VERKAHQRIIHNDGTAKVNAKGVKILDKEVAHVRAVPSVIHCLYVLSLRVQYLYDMFCVLFSRSCEDNDFKHWLKVLKEEVNMRAFINVYCLALLVREHGAWALID
jgi:hypothetical protein